MHHGHIDSTAMAISSQWPISATVPSSSAPSRLDDFEPDASSMASAQDHPTPDFNAFSPIISPCYRPIDRLVTSAPAADYTLRSPDDSTGYQYPEPPQEHTFAYDFCQLPPQLYSDGSLAAEVNLWATSNPNLTRLGYNELTWHAANKTPVPALLWQVPPPTSSPPENLGELFPINELELSNIPAEHPWAVDIITVHSAQENAFVPDPVEKLKEMSPINEQELISSPAGHQWAVVDADAVAVHNFLEKPAVPAVPAQNTDESDHTIVQPFIAKPISPRNQSNPRHVESSHQDSGRATPPTVNSNEITVTTTDQSNGKRHGPMKEEARIHATEVRRARTLCMPCKEDRKEVCADWVPIWVSWSFFFYSSFFYRLIQSLTA